MEKERNLKELLYRLKYLGLIRADLVSQLVESAKNGADIPKEEINRVIEICEKEGRFYAGARIAELAGLTEKAKELYIRVIEGCEEEGLFEDAAIIAEKIGLTKWARKLYKLAMKDYEEKRRFHAAARAAEKIGLTEKANELYKMARQKSIDYIYC